MTVKCQYCNKIIKDNADTCSGCGAPAPEINIQPDQNPDKKRNIVLGAIGACIFILGISALILLLTEPSGTPQVSQYTFPPPTQVQAPNLRPLELPTSETENVTAEGTRPYPHDAITDSGLRQGLELFFRNEIRNISWDDLSQIKTIAIDRDSITVSSYALPLSSLERYIRPDDPLQAAFLANATGSSSAYAVRVSIDSQVRDPGQLGYLENLTALSINSSIPASALARLPHIQELRFAASNDTPDITHLSALPNLQRLEIAGSRLTGLHGLSDLDSLYALTLRGTGLTDLSVLSLAQNITELTLIDNRGLGSFDTLQAMSWLEGLHIERSEGRNLAFISNLTNLESLTIVRTDTRTYDFILPLTALRYLRLFDNRDVIDMPSFAGFSQLEELHLDTGRNTGTPRPISYLEGLTSVRRMTLHNPDRLDALRGMQNLEELDIAFGWLLTDAAPLGYLSSLQRLQIYGRGVFNNEVSNMSSIGRLSNLRELNLTDTDLYFNWNFIYDMTSLERLYISSTNVIGDFSRISNLQNLRILDMNNVRLMTSYQISRTGGMVGISFVGVAPVQDFAASLAELSNLEFLSISGNGLRDIEFVSGMNNLLYLNIESNYISDVSPLAELPNLIHVDLRRNPIANISVLDDMINTEIVGR